VSIGAARFLGASLDVQQTPCASGLIHQYQDV
jgi:hypothetical protein